MYMEHEYWNPPYLFRKLGIGDQEAGDVALVEKMQEGVDLWVHYGFTH